MDHRTLEAIRKMATVAIEAEMMRALEQSANKYLGDRVAAIIEHLHDAPEDGGRGNAPTGGPGKAKR
ncbi:MerR family transcriptional regulator [Cupriavidus basilensis OR16]|uniref:MerR family transcriptional regulator n=1 Tax=Cupriavidus basilensis OR16 TaxID=1127483 RepID=H1SEE7_9BURK|nr:MerR family transcriptional regulator [Cupriavidus basilensis OR16]